MAESSGSWWEGQTIPVILNRGSGTVAQGPPEKIVELVEKETRNFGLRVDVRLVEPAEIEPVLAGIIESGAGAVMVGGGDGTIMNAARLLMGSSCALVPLPLGTLNLLARDLGFPLDPSEAIRALPHARSMRIDAAEVNGRLFLCVAVLGFYPNSAWRLGKEFHGCWWHKILWSSRHLLFSYFHYPSLQLSIDMGKEKHPAKTRFVAVSNNPYVEALGLVPQRPELNQGWLAVYISKHSSWWSLARGLAAFVLGRQGSDRDLEVLEAKKVVLRTRNKRKLKISLDGELYQLEQPLEFVIHPEALQVMALPKAVPGGQS